MLESEHSVSETFSILYPHPLILCRLTQAFKGFNLMCFHVFPIKQLITFWHILVVVCFRGATLWQNPQRAGVLLPQLLCWWMSTQRTSLTLSACSRLTPSSPSTYSSLCPHRQTYSCHWARQVLYFQHSLLAPNWCNLIGFMDSEEDGDSRLTTQSQGLACRWLFWQINAADGGSNVDGALAEIKSIFKDEENCFVFLLKRFFSDLLRLKYKRINKTSQSINHR